MALITGGGSGIGLMAAQALAVNGAKVYITGRSREKLDRVTELYNQNIPGQIISIPSDITDKESIDKLVQEISSRENFLSILINNAGISTGSQKTENENAEELRKSLFEDESGDITSWDDTFRTNVTQLFFVTSAFLPLLQKGSEKEHGWSSTVINITSISGIVKVSQHHFAYNVLSLVLLFCFLFFISSIILALQKGVPIMRKQKLLREMQRNILVLKMIPITSHCTLLKRITGV